MGKIGDLWVRLGLKKDGFDKGMGSVKKKGVDALKGVAGAAGVAMGAMEVFNRVVTANESNNDKWENTVRTMSNAVNEFFSALTSGDFSLFTQGLDNIKRKAAETAEALRQVEDAQTAYGYFNAKYQADFTEQLNVLRNKESTDAQRSDAKANAEEIIREMRSMSDSFSEKAVDAAFKMFTQRSMLSADSFSVEDVERVLIANTREGFEDELKLWDEQKREYDSLLEKLNKDFTKETTFLTNYGAVTTSAVDTQDPEYQKALKELEESYKIPLLNAAVFNKTNGEDFKSAIGFLSQAEQVRRGASRLESRLLQYGADDGTSTDAEPPPPPEGSLAYLQQQLKEAQDVAATAVGEEAQKTAMETVRKIEAEIEEMKNRITASLRDPWEAIPDLPAIPLPDKLESTSGLGLALPETDGADMDEFSSSTLEAADAVGVLAGAMSNLTGLVDDGAASWLSYGANVVQALAQAIPVIDDLTKAKNAEANANTEALVSGAGSSVASIPVVGPVMAIAAMASVIAALANIPKFAEGGVVGGSSYYGDRILARLNSGELVLNHGQQAALLDLMDQPVQRVEITGRLTASGRDLQYVLDRYDDYRRQ